MRSLGQNPTEAELQGNSENFVFWILILYLRYDKRSRR